MLVGDHVVFIFGVDRLVLRRNVDLVVRELVATKVLKEVRDAAGREMDMCTDGVFRLSKDHSLVVFSLEL